MEQNYPFDVSGNYQFPSTIEVAGSKSALKDAIAEFLSGVGSDAIMWTKLNSKDANYSSIGTGVGTLYNGATVSGQRLDLTGYATNRYLSIDTNNTSHNSQKGCMRILWTPDYNGYPTSEQYIAQWRNGGTENNIQIRHNTGGFVRVWIRDGSGGLIVDSPNLGTKSVVAGQTYELELNWNCDAGEHRLFIDGVQKGSTMTGTGTRDLRCDKFDFGVYYNNLGSPNFYIDGFIYYNDVQHTTDYTPTDWSEIPETRYVLTNPKIYPDATLRTDLISNIVLTSSVTGSDELRFAMEVDGVEKYWTGSAWATSTGYSETNTITEMVTNLSTLFTGYPVDVRWVMYLHSEDGSTTPEAINILVTYSFAGQDKNTVETCTVYWYMAENRTVNIFLKNDRVKYKTNVLLHREDYNIEKVADATEYCEVELPDTVNMELDELGNEQVYVVLLDGERHEVNVPNQDGALLFDLL